MGSEIYIVIDKPGYIDNFMPTRIKGRSHGAILVSPFHMLKY